MKRLFSNIEPARVGLYQPLLEENGIQTLVKNNNAPYKESWPELWVLDDSQYESAEKLLRDLSTQSNEPIESWTCPECSEPVDEGYGECWNCGSVKPELV